MKGTFHGIMQNLQNPYKHEDGYVEEKHKGNIMLARYQPKTVTVTATKANRN